MSAGLCAGVDEEVDNEFFLHEVLYFLLHSTPCWAKTSVT